MVGVTLRKIEVAPSSADEASEESAEDEADEAAPRYEWWIDLTSAKHKTSRL